MVPGPVAVWQHRFGHMNRGTLLVTHLSILYSLLCLYVHASTQEGSPDGSPHCSGHVAMQAHVYLKGQPLFMHLFIPQFVVPFICSFFLRSLICSAFSSYALSFIHPFRRDMCRGPSPRSRGVTLPVGSCWQRWLAKRGLS